MRKALTLIMAFTLLSVHSLIAQTVHSKFRPMVGSLTTWDRQIVPLVIVGEGWSQRIVLLDVGTSQPVTGILQFYTRDGQPWQVQMKDQGTASAFPVILQPGQSAIFETVVKTSSQQLGWASLQLTGDLFGQTIFRKQTPGLPDFMASMVLGSQTYEKLSVFFDNTGGNSTGMGVLTSKICSSFCSPLQLRVVVTGLDNAVISQRTISQSPGTLYWMNLAVDFPETAGITGTFVVEPVQAFSTTLTGFSLQFASNGAFTVITPFEPTVPVRLTYLSRPSNEVTIGVL